MTSLSPENSSFVSGNESIKCLRDGNLIVPFASLPNLGIVKVGPVGNNVTKSFTIDTDLLVNSIWEVGVGDLRNWNFTIQHPGDTSRALTISTASQIKVGDLAVLLPTIWTDMFVPKGTLCSINGSTANSTFWIIGQVVNLAHMQIFGP